MPAGPGYVNESDAVGPGGDVMASHKEVSSNALPQ